MRRLLPVIGLAFLLAAFAAGCLPPPEPEQNGRLSDSSLSDITPTCRVANDVAQPLRQLLAAAYADGVNVQPETKAYLEPLPIVPPRNESCYRTYEMQVWWRDLYCGVGHCEFAAVPGTSIHGWGRAVDFEDKWLGKLNFESPAYVWLQLHAAAYGFVHPAWAEPGGSAPEPWHWEHP
jgi:LAS superfamily LD-carboxypeptidase LdcB